MWESCDPFSKGKLLRYYNVCLPPQQPQARKRHPRHGTGWEEQLRADMLGSWMLVVRLAQKCCRRRVHLRLTPNNRLELLLLNRSHDDLVDAMVIGECGLSNQLFLGRYGMAAGRPGPVGTDKNG